MYHFVFHFVVSFSTFAFRIFVFFVLCQMAAAASTTEYCIIHTQPDRDYLSIVFNICVGLHFVHMYIRICGVCRTRLNGNAYDVPRRHTPQIPKKKEKTNGKLPYRFFHLLFRDSFSTVQRALLPVVRGPWSVHR